MIPIERKPMKGDSVEVAQQPVLVQKADEAGINRRNPA
jgi:hypothetical protein